MKIRWFLFRKREKVSVGVWIDCSYQNLNSDDRKVAAFHLHLFGSALIWLNALEVEKILTWSFYGTLCQTWHVRSWFDCRECRVWKFKVRRCATIWRFPQQNHGRRLSIKILQHCHFQQDHKAIKSTEDGDCLFNSVSTLLVGDESLPTELRYKTCIEMFINKEEYKNTKTGPASASCPLLTYDAAMKDCARPRQYSCIWTILALAKYR